MPSKIAGKYALDLDNVRAGWLFDAEGGHARRAGEVRHTLVFGGGMSEEFYAWVAASLAGTASPRAVAVGSADGLQWVEIANARVTGLGLRGGWWSLEIVGDRGDDRPAKPGHGEQARKAWMINNYEVSGRVNKIEALSVRPGPQPTLTLELDGPVDRYTSADGRGTVTARADDGQELFALEFTLRVAPDKMESGSEQLRGVAPDKMESGSEQLRRVKVELDCEEIVFKYTGAALG